MLVIDSYIWLKIFRFRIGEYQSHGSFNAQLSWRKTFATISTNRLSEPLCILKIFVQHLLLIVSSKLFVLCKYHFEHRYHPCDKENCVVTKTFENITTEPGCLWCWRRFVGTAAPYFYSSRLVKSKTYRLHFLQEIDGRYEILLFIFAL